MLSKIRFIVWLLILFVVAFFVSMNSEPKISIKLFPNYQTEPLPLSIVIIGSLITGAIIILIMAITDWLKFKIEIVKIRSKLSKAEKELNRCKEEGNKVREENTRLQEEINRLKENLEKEKNKLQVNNGNQEQENTASN
jgi:uncharacterized integral membrane protein